MDVVDAALKEKLWHAMRSDLQSYFPEMRHNNLLMCCTCMRALPYDDFSIEHIIPKQALADDPFEVKANPETSVNRRGVTTLLCNKRLKLKDRVYHNKGCNSWKGRFYDTGIREILNGTIVDSVRSKKTYNRHLIGVLSAAFLAMFKEYGYQVALTQAGRLMRRQFFSPDRFRKEVPLNSQLVLSGPPPPYSEQHNHLWQKPFKFAIERHACLVTFRTVGVRVPISRDPRTPIAKHLRIVPPRYALRPNFDTLFE